MSTGGEVGDGGREGGRGVVSGGGGAVKKRKIIKG